jgi:hypothetical protein
MIFSKIKLKNTNQIYFNLFQNLPLLEQHLFQLGTFLVDDGQLYHLLKIVKKT